MIPAPKVSVIIVSYNTGPILFRCIEAVLRQEGLHELIVVNNGNPPEVKEHLFRMAKDHAHFLILSGQGNIGFAAGCNLGVSRANGEYVLLLNPDCIIPHNTLLRVVKALKKYPQAWLAGCRVVNPDGSEQSGSRRNTLTPMVAMVEALKLYRLFPNGIFRSKGSLPRISLSEEEAEANIFVVPAISGAFMMMTRERYQALGGIDEGYFFHVEDLDFCYRIVEQGGKIIFMSALDVVHYRSTSKVSPFFIEWNKARGFSRYFRIHFSKGFPGLLILTLLGIYARCVVRFGVIFIRQLFTLRLRRKEKHRLNLNQRRVELLRQYREVRRFDAPHEEGDSTDYGDGPVLLVGASGQVGISVMRLLLSLNTEIIALYHKTVLDFSHPCVQWLHGDVSTPSLPLEGFAPKTVIYTPSLWLLPQHIDQLAKVGVKRIIAFSSTSLFSKAESTNAEEKALVARLRKAEEDIARKCAQHGIDWTIFRPTLIYGIGLDRNVSSIMRFIQRFYLFPIMKPGKGLRQPVHTNDLAEATITVMDLKRCFNQAYNLGGGEILTYRTMVERIYEAMGRKPRILSVSWLPLVMDIFAAIVGKPDINGEIARRMNKDLVFSIDAAVKDFNYTPRSFLVDGEKDLGL